MANEALYTLKIQTETSQLDKVAKDVDALKNAPTIGLKTDTAAASASIAELKRQTSEIAQQAIIAIKCDSTQATSGLTSVKSGVESVSKGATIDLKVNTAQAEGALGKIKSSIGELGKGAGTFALGGMAAGGAMAIAGEFIGKAKEMSTANAALNVGLARTNLTADQSQEEFKRLGEQAEKVADKFAIPKNEVTALQGRIAGFSGTAGAQLDKLTELSIGAADALQMAPEQVAKMLAKATDPESVANLGKLGITFEKNATITDKMAVIQNRYGKAIDASAKSAQDAPHMFEALKNKVEESVVGVAGSLFEGIAPVLKAIMPLVSVLGTLLGSVAGPLGELVGVIVGPVAQGITLLVPIVKWLADVIGGALKNEISGGKEAFGAIGTVFDGIIHLDFGKVWTGLKSWVDGLLNLIPGVSIVKSLASTLGLTSDKEVDLKNKSADAGVAGVKAADDAADAQKRLKESIDGAIQGYTDQEAATKAMVDKGVVYTAMMRKAVQELETTGKTTINGVVYGKEWLDTIEANITKNIGLTKQLSAEQAADAVRDAKARKDSTVGDPAKKATAEQLLGAAEKKADIESKSFDTMLRTSLMMNGIVFSKKDELVIEKAKLDYMTKEIEAVKGVSAAKKSDALIEKTVPLREAVGKTTAEIAKEDADARKKAWDDTAKHETDVLKSLAQSTVDIMKEGRDKDIAEEGLKWKVEEQQFLDAKGRKRTLDAAEAELKLNLEKIHKGRLLEIDKKYHQDASAISIEAQKLTDTAVQGLLSSFFATKEQMTMADIHATQLGFQMTQRDLTKQLMQGQISQKQYSVGLEKLAQDKKNFEIKQEGEKWAFVKKISSDEYDSLLKKGEDYLGTHLALYAAEALGFASAEESKTIAQDAASAIRIGKSIAEGAASLISAGATMVSTVATELYEAVASLGPIAGPAVGIAAAGALYAGYRGIKSMVGMETGGIMVGEHGKPEVISPAKEFSEFAGRIVSQTVKAVQQGSQAGSNSGGSRGGRMTVGIDGKLVQKGRDLTYQFQRDQIGRKSEQMIPV